MVLHAGATNAQCDRVFEESRIPRYSLRHSFYQVRKRLPIMFAKLICAHQCDYDDDHDYDDTFDRGYGYDCCGRGIRLWPAGISLARRQLAKSLCLWLLCAP